jgi:REP element-mobilizing transposase RayT
VTLRLSLGRPTLRSKAAHEAVSKALVFCNERYGVRFIHYVAMSNHIHLICEADDVESLRRGVSALVVRLARTLQRTWNLRGPVFGDRFHSRSLSTPREVRNALAYVFLNAQHHGVHLPEGLDPFSSAAWFDGWADARGDPLPPRSRSLLSAPNTWLLSKGWKHWGLIERPGGS